MEEEKEEEEDIGEDGDEEEPDDEEKYIEEDVEEEDEEDEDAEDEGEDEGEDEEEEEDASAAGIIREKLVARDRLLFYTGMILIMVGGPGLAFGSWLHDVLSIPVVGETYAAFGWINMMFAVAGVIAMVVGIIFLVLSLRGGALTQDEFERLKAEGLT